jgi:lipopolysaccharide export system permease protein
MSQLSLANRSMPWGVSLLDRYILRELLLPFLFGVVAFSSIGVAIGVLFDLVRRVTEVGLPMGIAFQVFALRLPYFVGLAFPMSMLLSCLMVYGRLSGDSELIALRSCGVSVLRLIAPAILLGLLVTGITFAFNEAVVPACNREATLLLDRALNRKEPSFREKNILYQEFRDIRDSNGKKEKQLSRIFYAGQFDGQQMKGLTIVDFSQNGLNQIVAAEAAKWNNDEKIWDFRNGTVYVIAPDGSYRSIVRFENQQIQLPRVPLDLANSTKDPGEMNIAEIRNYLQLLAQSGDDKEFKRFTLRIDQKISLPFACLVFGLLGSALGNRPQRTSRAAGFGLSLIIIVGYYLCISIGEALYTVGFLSSVLGAWLPTFVVLVPGLWLLWKISR